MHLLVFNIPHVTFLIDNRLGRTGVTKTLNHWYLKFVLRGYNKNLLQSRKLKKVWRHYAIYSPYYVFFWMKGFVTKRSQTSACTVRLWGVFGSDILQCVFSYQCTEVGFTSFLSTFFCISKWSPFLYWKNLNINRIFAVMCFFWELIGF